MTEQTNPADRAYVPPRVAAERLYVSVKTLGRMADRGEIAFIKLPSGHRRYDMASIAEALRHEPSKKTAEAAA
ncbi:hypothetical protein [Microbacterium resistens]|nr:hypothetical protein [Streptomyces sp. MS2A]